jgi:hypothetical protein
MAQCMHMVLLDCHHCLKTNSIDSQFIINLHCPANSVTFILEQVIVLQLHISMQMLGFEE